MKKLALVSAVALSLSIPAVARGQEQPAMCEGIEATIVGTEGPDVITGTSADDVIAGLGGNDVIDGAGGWDRICGDDGSDNITDEDGAALVGGEGNDTLTAGTDEASSVYLLGGHGNDSLTTLSGTLFSHIRPGPDDDTVEGNAVDDHLSYEAAANGVQVNLTTGVATGEGTDQLSGIERLKGSPFDDHLIGTDRSDFLTGGRGADEMEGLGGVDRFVIGQGDDTVRGGLARDWVVLDSDAAYLGTTNLATGTFTTGQGDDARLFGIDSVVGGRRLIGNNSHNRLYGGAGADFIDGKRGRDQIKGGGGWDRIFAGKGNDYVTGCGGGGDRIQLGPDHDTVDPVGARDCSMYPGRDVIDGGPGRDLVTYELLWVRLYGGVNADLVEGACIRCGGERKTQLIAMEDIRGSDGDDRLAGNHLANNLHGFDGNDTLNGRGGRDRVSGGPGTDNCVEGEYRTGCE